MFKLLKSVVKTGDVTTQYPAKPIPVADGFRGKPELDAQQCLACGACMRACPANALVMETDVTKGSRRWELSMARCIYCGRCEEVCPTHAISLSQNFELAVTNKKDLYEEATFELANCEQCGKPFVASKLAAYTRELLMHNLAFKPGQSTFAHFTYLNSCPTCRALSHCQDGAGLNLLTALKEAK
jgi:formate hydrogenlyase subunit 6/NADH:ubiquinone oxidoreductase subunit I